MLLEQRESTDLLLAPQTDEENKQLRRPGESKKETGTETRWRQDGDKMDIKTLSSTHRAG